ncbi:GDSL esterase/lipase At5g55050 [Eucalyptus grandis]|uniref:GDSL esterase/lipase At5g55050 n=1 Tax=Eucalyptus grandis TaxID=71139 RepID=UPI00192E763E|nr:GDSL esterase/lipase At5g55050 [Eucalyptus grandis]
MAEPSSPLLSSLPFRNTRNLHLLCAVGMMLASALADDVPPVFIFGDSTFDVGTNNHIHSGATANFRYYGIDFPYSLPTGRFSNGYNSADLIVRQLGYEESPPPFLALVLDNSTFQSNILRGVNFASGGAGILDGTGNRTWGEVIPMAQQVQQFATVQGNITWLLGQNESAKFFNSSLFFISVGSNDIFDHYLYDNATVSQPELMAALQSNYTAHLTLQGMIYSLGDAYNMTSTLMDVPPVLGIENIEEACCGSGLLNAAGPCNITQDPKLCPNRYKYLFWDWFHPTQYVAQKAAIALFTGDLRFVSPMNFSQLAQASA